MSDPQRESDADADIEDTDCRLDVTPRVSAVFFSLCCRLTGFYVLSDSRSRGHSSGLVHADASGHAFQGRTPQRVKTTAGEATDRIAGTSG